MELMEHAFHVAHDSYLALTKSAKNFHQSVCEFWPGEQVIDRIKDHAYSARFLRVGNVPHWLVVQFFSWDLLCITTNNYVLHEVHII